MHIRRFACLLLGIWIGGSLFMTFVATQNFRSVDRTIEREEVAAQQSIKLLGGPDQARVFLRHHVGEQNRFYFRAWEYTQLALGTGMVLLLVFGSHPPKGVLLACLIMVGLVAVMRLSVTPSITALGRELDFLPAGQDNLIRTQFRTWHSAYAVLEIVKLILAVVAGVLLIAGREVRRRVLAGSQLDAAARS